LSDGSSVQFGVVDAVRRDWRLVALVVGLALAVGVALSVVYKPSFTAQTRLNVGRLDVSTQSIPGYAAGIQSLTVSYARTLSADEVVRPVAKRLGLSVVQVASHLNGSPVPLSPLIVVEASSGSAGGAVRLANEASDQLVRYLSTVNLVNPDADRLLADFKAASRVLNDRTDVQKAAGTRYRASRSAADRRALSRARASVQEQNLRVQALQGAYLNSQRGLDSASLVQVLNRARLADSDRSSHVQAVLFASLVIGLLLGLALALARSRSAVRRALLQQ
jgi:capsular polysaccharide biosynthesis protein